VHSGANVIRHTTGARPLLTYKKPMVLASVASTTQRSFACFLPTMSHSQNFHQYSSIASSTVQQYPTECNQPWTQPSNSQTPYQSSPRTPGPSDSAQGILQCQSWRPDTPHPYSAIHGDFLYYQPGASQESVLLAPIQNTDSGMFPGSSLSYQRQNIQQPGPFYMGSNGFLPDHRLNSERLLSSPDTASYPDIPLQPPLPDIRSRNFTQHQRLPDVMSRSVQSRTSQAGNVEWLSTVLNPPSTPSKESNYAQTIAGDLKLILRNELPDESSMTCDICNKNYSSLDVNPSSDKEVAIQLPCGHIFGQYCTNEWFETCRMLGNKVTCPMCRKVLVEPNTAG
jgi:hypothetical protein